MDLEEKTQEYLNDFKKVYFSISESGQITEKQKRILNSYAVCQLADIENDLPDIGAPIYYTLRLSDLLVDHYNILKNIDKDMSDRYISLMYDIQKELKIN